MNSGDLNNPDVFVDAARRAQAAFDYGLTERFARAALAQGERFGAQIILGESLTRQKRVEEAERAIAQATESAASDPERTRASIAFANLLFFYSNRQREATEFLQKIEGNIADTGCQREIDATLSLFVGITGNLDSAVDLGVRATQGGDPGQPEGLPSLTASTVAQIMRGQVREPEVAVQRGLRSAEQLQGELALWRHLLFGNLALLYYYSARLREADDLTRDQYLDAIQQAEPMAGFWADVRAENLLLRGRIEEGLRLAQEGEPLLRQWDVVGMLPVTISRRVVFHAVLGDVAGATAAMARLAPYHTSEDARVRFAIGRARTWLAIAEGRLGHATEQALQAGDRAERDGMVVWTANLFHDIVRIGHPEAVAGRLAALAERAEAEIVHVEARHASALASADREGLQGVAEAFSRMGASLLAAEAYAQVSQVSTEQGHSSDAKAAAQRAVLEAERCGPVRTPALASLSGSLLTRREREIAQLAARGASSREIAKQLSLSVRTVDNHLGSIYGKFGIQGRNELAKAIGLSSSGLGERTAPS
ncbi:MAG TPA: LuxR C-terminal-related transcriptional regulator [Thermoanaerobaculia bacterium]|nr:LuxR C-terminal-related transcriptional regulator [Thermoanaerobaculia bacterium]